MNPLFVVEAALFSSGRPVSIEEIQHETGLHKKDIEKAIKALQKSYAERDTCLEVGKAGAKWAMQVRSVASEPAAKFAPMEIPKKVLKTLALIAYHQPLKQSELKEMIGQKVYDHVGELKERGLIKTRRDGMTKTLTTTDSFPEYFGLDAATPEQIRRVMAKLVGIDPDAEPAREIESFQTPDPAQASEDAPEQEASEPSATTDMSTHPDQEAKADEEDVLTN